MVVFFLLVTGSLDLKLRCLCVYVDRKKSSPSFTNTSFCVSGVGRLANSVSDGSRPSIRKSQLTAGFLSFPSIYFIAINSKVIIWLHFFKPLAIFFLLGFMAAIFDDSSTFSMRR